MATRIRRTKGDLLEEKAELFGQVLDLRAAGVKQAYRFGYGFTTDGVSIHLLYERSVRTGALALLTLPRCTQGEGFTPVSTSSSACAASS